jgi:hypothetical protein
MKCSGINKFVEVEGAMGARQVLTAPNKSVLPKEQELIPEY